MGWSMAEEVILRIGAVAVALTAIAAALALVGRVVIVRPLRHFIAEALEEPARRVERLEAEFHPNSGTSMRDAVTRLETKVDRLAEDLSAHERHQHAA